MLPKGSSNTGYTMDAIEQSASKPIAIVSDLNEEQIAILEAMGIRVIDMRDLPVHLGAVGVVSGDVAVKRSSSTNNEEKGERVLLGGRLKLNFEQCAVYFDGRRQDVTLNELNLLNLMSCKPGKVFTRKKLLVSIGKWHCSDRVVDVDIKRVRVRLDSLEKGLRGLVRTRSGIGYEYNENGVLQREPALAAE